LNPVENARHEEILHDSEDPASLETESQVDDPVDGEPPCIAPDSNIQLLQKAGPSVAEQKEAFCKNFLV
jgi:hypothetical protein